jgi:predicted  nucleic acid-binding Zn-ribbon protein
LVSSLIHPDYDKKKAVVERRKEQFQKKIEDLELDAAVLDHKIMQYNQQIDHLKNRMSLASYLPYRKSLDIEYQFIQEEKERSYKQLLDIKSEIVTIIYDIEELDLEVTRLSELVGAADS